MSRRTLPVIALITALAAGLCWSTMNVADDADSDRLLRHVVCFKFKADATAAQIEEVEQAFARLPSQIDAIVDFEWGTNNSPEDHAKGFTHCFIVTFRDEEGRAEYLPHDAHSAFVAIVGPVVEDVFVIDYWTP
jgi:hypothetical protein